MFPRNPNPNRNWSPPWLILLAGSTLLIILGDLTLLATGTGFLTDGFNVEPLDSIAAVLGFLVLSIPLDLFLVLFCWSGAIPILNRLPGNSFQCYCLTGVLGVGIPLAFSAARYNVYAIAGGMFNVALLSGLANVSSSSQVAQIAEELPLLWITVLPFATLFGAVRRTWRLHANLFASASTGLCRASRCHQGEMRR